MTPFCGNPNHFATLFINNKDDGTYCIGFNASTADYMIAIGNLSAGGKRTYRLFFCTRGEYLCELAEAFSAPGHPYVTEAYKRTCYQFGPETFSDKDALLTLMLPPFAKQGQSLYPAAHLMKYADASLRSNAWFVRSAMLKAHPSLLIYADPVLSTDKTFAASLMKDDPSLLQYFDESVRSDPNFVLPYIKAQPSVLQYTGDILRDNEVLISRLMRTYPDIYQYASQRVANIFGKTSE